MTQLAIDFSSHGPDVRPQDERRFGKQLTAVREYCLRNQGWLPLAWIARAVGASDASVSARLRDLRALGFIVDRRRIQGSHAFEYRVRVAP